MYQKVEKMAPDSQEGKESGKHAHILLGRKYGELGQFDQALKELSGVLADYPDDITALMNKGLTLSYMGRLDEEDLPRDEHEQVEDVAETFGVAHLPALSP